MGGEFCKASERHPLSFSLSLSVYSPRMTTWFLSSLLLIHLLSPLFHHGGVECIWRAINLEEVPSLLPANSRGGWILICPCFASRFCPLSLSCSLLSISVLLIYRTSSTTKYLELNHRAYIYIYIFKLRIKCRKKANVYLSFSWNRDKTLATAAFLSVERQSVVTITRILVNRNIRFLILLF